ncbi:hypothetical protein ACFE33_15505 (plasmid) [Falsihalocynthiibacter sp. SS001]|uniref:hypothetical protein n=1 Tax=Falsihalocynthiibacter sp. SS001 TaxID=3349698 RepID=UPI0036D32FEA
MKHLIFSALLILAPTLGHAATTVELNALEQQEDACRMTFTITSEEGLSALQTQTVLFDESGAVHLFTLFDFGEIPAGGMRVRQFDIPTLPCDKTKLVLFNGIEQCESEGGACENPLNFTSRIDGLEVQQ